MLSLLKKTILILLLALIMPKAFAQESSTQGKEFWVSYMGNGFKDNHFPSYVDTQLLISAKRSCSGTITNPITGWSHTFTVEANNITSIDIPNEQAYNEASSYEVVATKGLQIITTDTVTVYCTNIAANSFDASYVLPIQALADDYIVQTYDQSTESSFGSDFAQYLTSAFLIVGVVDNTTIDITPTVETLGGKAPGEEFTITLQAGETYQVRSNKNSGFRDLTGTHISARDCKPIAVFNGNTLTTVPTTLNNGYDHIFEQAMPVRSWGKKFVVTQSNTRQRDYVKVVSAADGNVIKKNGEVMETLQTGESCSFFLYSSERSCYIETSAPSAVYLYNTTSSDGKGNGDPSMLWISPIEQRLNEITLATFSGDAAHNSSINHHYINIIVATEDINKVYFDGELLSSNEFTPVNGNAEYSFARKGISYDSHHLACVNGFNAHVYGFGSDRGYAYMVGSNAADLSTTLFINDEVVVHNDTVAKCDLDPVTFNADINYNNYEIVWDLGDGSSSTETSLAHTYNEHGFYTVSFTITTQENPCLASTTTTSVFYLDMRREPDQNFSEEICYKGPDTYTENGFNLHYEDPGMYHDSYSVTNENGCESLISLDLYVADLIETEPQIESGHCDSFEWYGNAYTQSGHYSDTLVNDIGCFSVYYLDLDLDYTPNPTEITPADAANTAPHWVITSTEFQINEYEFMLEDRNPECEWDTVTWSLEDGVIWVLEPLGEHGSHCKMYVLDRLEDTVWMSAKVYNDCHPQGIERRYWFVCSFYDIEENDPSTPSTSSGAFSVTPNPNNGQMQLNFENLTGAIDLKVYNANGVLIDNLLFSNENEHHTFYYHCPVTSSGMYFFVASGKEGTLTKKVIIQ